MSQQSFERESARFSRCGALLVTLGVALVACAGDRGDGVVIVPVGSGVQPTAGIGGAAGMMAGGASGVTGTISGGAGMGNAGVGSAGTTPGTAGMSGGGSGMSGAGDSEPMAGGGTGGDGGSAGTGGALIPTCTGKPGAPGLNARSIAGRNVLVHIPQSVDPNTGVPLLLVHHGYFMDGEAMRALTGFQAIADREGFAVAFPDGADTTWNVGAGACGAGALGSGTADDIAFVNMMIASIEADQCLSREHVFMTGFSMGGYFSNHAGCQMSGVIRGIAPHSGGAYADACPAGPIPVMIWHGTADTTVEPSCGPNARDVWVARNGCQPTFDTVQVANGTCEWHQGCPPGAQVVLCMMSDMPHQWSGGTGLIGAPGYENASEMMWTFFKEQSGL